MKKLGWILSAALFIGLTACNNHQEDKQDCIYCTGCFNSWDECEDSYRPSGENPMNWEEYSTYMIENPSGATWQCERVAQ